MSINTLKNRLGIPESDHSRDAELTQIIQAETEALVEDNTPLLLERCAEAQ